MKALIFYSLKPVQKGVFWLNQWLIEVLATNDVKTDLSNIDAAGYYQKLKTGDL